MSDDLSSTVTVLNAANHMVEGLVTVLNVIYHFEHNATDTLLIPASEFYNTAFVCGAKNTWSGRRRRQLKLAEAWTDCFTPTPVTYKIGVVIDLEMFKYLEAEGIEPEIYADQMISQANVIYTVQVSMQIKMTQILVIRNETAPFFTTCKTGTKPMDRQLAKMAEWQTAFDIKTVGYWHLFSGCDYSDPILGLTYIDTLCAHPFNVGLSRGKSNISWWVFAHEMGHHIGAQHSFENGVGTTGGLMDYDTTPLDGAWQFNSAFQKNPVCTHIQRALTQSCPFFSKIIPIKPIDDDSDDDNDTTDATWIAVVAVTIPAFAVLAYGLYVVYQQQHNYKKVFNEK